jgi:hypothetical protein
MQSENIQFPVYLKYKNNTSYYRIDSLESFVELQKMGTKVFKYEIKAKIYPDRLRILDMIVNEEQLWSTIDSEEFNALAGLVD